MTEHLKVTLSDDEFTGLAKLCQQDLRNPQFEIRWLLLRELERRSMLPAEAVVRLLAEEGKSMKENK